MNTNTPAYLTTSELAELLRIKERKVYDMAASGEVPCSRAMGKLLFPRDQIEAWLAANASGPVPASTAKLPAVMLGSHDPLLDWAMRESRCGLAGFFDSSMDGLEQFANNKGMAAGVHIAEEGGNGWNVQQVESLLAGRNVAVVEWARRQRGLIVQQDTQDAITTLADLASKTVALRQPEAGSQILLKQALAAAGIAADNINWTAPARSETDAATLVQDGKADAAFGLACVAKQLQLGFHPVTEERYDLVVDRAAWFSPPMQSLMAYCKTEAFREQAASLAGYDVSGQFQVHYNA